MGRESGKLSGKACNLIFKPSTSSDDFEVVGMSFLLTLGKDFLLIVSPIFSKSAFVFNNMFQFKKYGISHELSI